MLPLWLAELRDEWDVIRFSTFTNYCWEDLVAAPPAPKIFRARMRRLGRPTCDGVNESWPGIRNDRVAWGGSEFNTYLGTHANLLTREGAKNVLASMLGCGVRAMDYCGYPESMPNQRVISGPDPEYIGGRLYRSYAIPTHTVLIQGDLDSDIGP